MTKIILTGVVLASLITSLNANQKYEKFKLPKNPIDKSFLSIENGGNKSAIDAYSDGIGLSVVGIESLDNSAMNELVFVHGEKAKANEVNLKDYLENLGTSKDIEIIVPTASGGTIVGDPCNDGKSNTINDIYVDTNGTCVGVLERSENKCFGDKIGTQFYFNGKLHLVVDDVTIRNNLDRAETLCTSNVNHMDQMFSDNSLFNQNISSWDVSNVISFDSMFKNATSFNQDISGWDVSNATNMTNMFVYATSFNQDISEWNVLSMNDPYIFTFPEIFADGSPLMVNRSFLPKVK